MEVDKISRLNQACPRPPSSGVAVSSTSLKKDAESLSRKSRTMLEEVMLKANASLA